MKRLTVSVSEEKYDFFVELMKSLDFISIDDFPTISKEEQDLVRKRKETSTIDSFKNWDDVKSQFKVN